MRISIKRLIALFSLLAVILGGCSSDDSNPTDSPNGGGATVDLSTVTIDIPPAMASAASANPSGGAAQAQLYLQMLNSFTAFTGFLQPPSAKAAKVAADGVYTWTQGGLSITLTVQDTGSEIYWEVKVNGSDGEQTYADFVLLDGYREKTVNSGMLNLYDPMTENGPATYWSWSTDPDGVFSVNHFGLNSNVHVFATVQVNGSGSVSYYLDNVMRFGSNWNTDGSGEFTIYDASGSMIDTGAWPA